MNIDTEIKALQDAFHDHAIDDDARFKDLNEKADANIVLTNDVRHMLEEQNKVMQLHMDTVEPYLQGIAGLGIVWKGLIAIGGLLAIWVSIKVSFWK